MYSTHIDNYYECLLKYKFICQLFYLSSFNLHLGRDSSSPRALVLVVVF